MLVESIVVNSAWYGKQVQSTAEHEFLLIRVKDIANEGYTNHIILDRNINKTEPAASTTCSCSRSCPTDAAAHDQFRIAYDGNARKLLEECSFNSNQMLEQIEFLPEKPFCFYELVTLANVVSELYPRYSTIDANCYLYAGLIWECMLQAYPDATHRDDLKGNRGKFGWIRYAPKQEAKECVYKAFQERLVEVQKKLRKVQKVRARIAAVEKEMSDEE